MVALHKRNLWHQLGRRARACAKRLRRDGAAIGLLLLLTLGLGEPLLCILHCQIWLPAVYSGYFATQHQHMHHHMPGMAGMDMPGMDMSDSSAAVGAGMGDSSAAVGAGMSNAAAATQLSAPAPAGQPGAPCSMRGEGGAGVPFHVPDSPVHDLIPALALLILVAQRVYRYQTTLPGTPSGPALAILLRPPILPAI